MTELADLTALQARNLIASGDLSALDLTEACLARIAERDPEIGAWQYLDAEGARRQASAADVQRRSNRPCGPLHGLPVGIKDIIDVAGLPCENGTALDAGRRPKRDAHVVTRLRAAGAIIMGKTVTTELAYFHPGKTKNPHDPSRTPGGSSSGSVAAVAAGMVPLAVGSQTAGSVIRPASYCGVVGYKPSFGLIGRSGVLLLASPLDTLGVFARTIEDVALIGDVVAGYDPNDADSVLGAPPQLLDFARAKPPAPPMVAFVKQPAWEDAEPGTKEAFMELAAELGDRCHEVPLPKTFERAAAAHQVLMRVGFAHNLLKYYERGKDTLSPTLRAAIEEGQEFKAVAYLTALDFRDGISHVIEEIMRNYSVIVTPAAPGEAPKGLDATGSPAFNVIWTMLGVPAITLPLMQGPDGMPLGVQLVGQHGHDGKLLRTASWLAQFLAQEES
jgi:Asp-tRNA(Asn)/Glu-tRNA(Gln) amidotransferase A subunit family amidase